MQLAYIVSFLSSRHSRFGVFFDWLVLIAVLYCVLIDYVKNLMALIKIKVQGAFAALFSIF